MGVFDRIQEAVEERTGTTLVAQDRLAILETVEKDYSALRKDLDLIGWTVMDYLAGQPQEVNAQSRRKFAQQARTVWEQDPQAGAAVDLLNDFTFGRGVPKPRAKDPKVQEIIDEAWDDPDNQLVLTSYAAQIALGTDLSLQSNLFLVMFDDGDDGRIKLGLIDHDTVEHAVRDPENRLRVLYYVAKHRKQEWDFENDKPKVDYKNTQAKTLYYPHWRNVTDLEEREENYPKPPPSKKGDGKVYHIAVNRRTEQVFGTPTMRRTIRWFTAYNDFMKARVDIVQASAAFIMKRKVKGTPNQVAKLAAKAISRESPLSASGAGLDSDLLPARAQTITENEGVEHEGFKLPTGAGDAVQDGQGIRSQISAATRFPQHYLGDAGSANLATATAMELPVLKAVEARQEVFEQVFRWFLDRVIERAVDVGNLDKFADPTEEEEAKDLAPVADTGAFGPQANGQPNPLALAAHEDQAEDEERTERDLSYEFGMPSPLRRMMTDLVSAVSNIAKTFDPNATNMELSRTLLTVALGEGLEIEDPAEAVDAIFPEGYQDPAVAAAMAGAGGAPPGNTGTFGPPGNPQGENNPYGAPMRGSTQDQMQETAITRGRDGEPIVWLREQRFGQLPDDDRDRANMRRSGVEEQFAEEVEAVVAAELDQLLLTSGNGNGKGST
jgi:hypothetical protein